MNLNCPSCGNILSKIMLSDIVIDVCQGGCAGIWFNKNEITKFDEKREKDGEVLIKLKKNPDIKIDTAKDRICPACDIKLTKHLFGDKQEVEIDECEKCGGLWLDSGELALIRGEDSVEADKDTVARQQFLAYSGKLFKDAEIRKAEKVNSFDKFLGFVGNKLGLD